MEKVVRMWLERCLKEEKGGEKGKDAECRSLWCPIWSGSILFKELCRLLLLHPAPVLKDTSSSLTSQLFPPPPAPTSSLDLHLLGHTRRLGCQVGRHGSGKAWGKTLTPAPPSSRAPNPPGSQIKAFAGRQPAVGRATSCRSRRPRRASLLDSLSVAVPLSFLSRFAAAAGAGFTASAPAAAGLAGQAAVLQRGAGVRPLQAAVLQEQRLEHREVLLAASDLSPQQHDVCPIPSFLRKCDRRKRRRTLLE